MTTPPPNKAEDEMKRRMAEREQWLKVALHPCGLSGSQRVMVEIQIRGLMDTLEEKIDNCQAENEALKAKLDSLTSHKTL